MERLAFTPQPAGFGSYHTHTRAGANLHAGTYSALAGPVYIEPRNEAGAYDRGIFITLKEFEPFFSRGGDMALDFLEPPVRASVIENAGESAMNASLAKAMLHGYEVGYRYFTINGRMPCQREPIRVRRGERVLFHVLNASATEIRSLALPGHTFRVVALDGNPVPAPAEVPALWLGTAERISAIVEVNQPGVWVLGDLTDEDRSNGMGIVVEYAGSKGKPEWTAAKSFRWSYARFGVSANAVAPDEHIEMLIKKRNAADDGFNQWTINGVAIDMQNPRPTAHLRKGRRQRIHLRNASDDIHPVHLHRHSFELASFAGIRSLGSMKDVPMLGGYQEAEIDLAANNPRLTLFHCHQQLHMDYGFMSLFEYV
jgi:FtsP/CotA-like multicopper oxidase with cupredoxin domain